MSLSEKVESARNYVTQAQLTAMTEGRSELTHILGKAYEMLLQVSEELNTEKPTKKKRVQ
jgi:hypothetical protein